MSRHCHKQAACADAHFCPADATKQSCYKNKNISARLERKGVCWAPEGGHRLEGAARDVLHIPDVSLAETKANETRAAYSLNT